MAPAFGLSTLVRSITPTGQALKLDRNFKIQGPARFIELDTIQMNDRFDVWCVTYDSQSKKVIPLRQTSWSLSVDSSKSNQRATTPNGDKNVSVMPVTSGPIANIITETWTPIYSPLGDDKIIVEK